MKTTVLVAAACVVLAGCETTPIEPRAKECETLRDVNVRVVDATHIVVDQEPIVVCKTNQLIRWQIVAGPYRFKRNGIVVQDYDNEFADCTALNSGSWQQNGQRFVCHDKNNKHGQPGQRPRWYKYQINLEIPGSSADSDRSLDPWVLND